VDELIEAVVKQTGLPEAQARKAAEAVVKFLKDKLPAPLASQVDAVIGQAGAAGAGGVEDLLEKGMGLLGKK